MNVEEHLNIGFNFNIIYSSYFMKGENNINEKIKNNGNVDKICL